MNGTADTDLLKSRLLTFYPERHETSRSLALYSAAVVTADHDCMEQAVETCHRFKVSRDMLYEIVLQSYLFLGFPRMLIASESLDRMGEIKPRSVVTEKISDLEAEQWFNNGLSLYEKVYDSNAKRLRDKVEKMAPEVFRWMIIEGYGKVLSRPELDVVKRELSITAFLMMENREKQLFSHMRGALNVGAEPQMLLDVIEDIGPAAGDGYRTSKRLAGQLGIE